MKRTAMSAKKQKSKEACKHGVVKHESYGMVLCFCCQCSYGKLTPINAEPRPRDVFEMIELNEKRFGALMPVDFRFVYEMEEV